FFSADIYRSTRHVRLPLHSIPYYHHFIQRSHILLHNDNQAGSPLNWYFQAFITDIRHYQNILVIYVIQRKLSFHVSSGPGVGSFIQYVYPDQRRIIHILDGTCNIPDWPSILQSLKYVIPDNPGCSSDGWPFNIVEYQYFIIDYFIAHRSSLKNNIQ